MKQKFNLAMHGATVAMTPARVLTSHLRRRYNERYRGRFLHAPWIFLFDVVLVGVIALLVGVNLYFRLIPAPRAGVRLILSAQPILSAAPTALEAKVISRDEKTLQNLKLSWELPLGTEILSASPPLSADREVFLGTLSPGETQTARVVVRLFVPQGSVRLGFRVQNGGERFFGSETRPVAGSGLRLEPLLRPFMLKEGAVLPFLLKNDTPQVLETVQILLEGGATVNGRSEMTIGRLAPFESRVFLVDPHRAPVIRLQALSHAVPLVQQTLPLQYSSVPFPVEIGSLNASTPGGETSFNVQAATSARILVFHPSLSEAKNGTRLFEASPGRQKIILPLTEESVQTAASWFVMPFMENRQGLILGPVHEAPITTPFHLTSGMRYYAASGDQIGIGPLPPRVGETTKYWVSWKLGATTADLSNFIMHATLSPGVTLTGREALPQGGRLTYQNGEVIWQLPFVPAMNEGFTANFEMAFTPTRGMRNTVPTLVGAATATATENRTQTFLQTVTNALDTNLMGDERARGKGKVR
ncbi:MAG: hypothetical protein Q7N87_03515 [Candidatus Uhrbacteria bacterium]|nr:hypothetical protein [Candidatus Uhrbacteria bacterium]